MWSESFYWLFIIAFNIYYTIHTTRARVYSRNKSKMLVENMFYRRFNRFWVLITSRQKIWKKSYSNIAEQNRIESLFVRKRKKTLVLIEHFFSVYLFE